MLRRLLLLSAIAAFGSETAYALGLGEIELESALNQNFEAEIVLTNVRGLEPQEILPGLASQEDFERVGIDRSYELTDLRFSVITNDEGNLAVRIRSTRPVVEPFLNFLVEVLWPSGRILREYTVLLDPPIFGEQGVERIAAPVQSREASRPSVQRQPEPEPEPEPEMATRERRLDQGSRSGDEYGMTGPGDTLWTIAMDVRPDDSISVQQMMLALKRANPNAFINDNINLLKAGYVLRVPGEREIREETFQSAVAKVRAENDAFATYRGGQSTAQMDASPRRPSATQPGQPSSQDGELRLLASDGGTGGERAGQGGGNNARVGELENQLSVAEEDLDRARRANSEMNSRLSDLEEQLKTLNEIVKLKDDQLAALRAEVMRMQSEPAAAAPAQPAPRTSASGGLLTNPFVLGALALILVIAAAGGMIFMRRKRAAGDDFEEEEFTTIASEADDVPEDGLDDNESALALEEEEEDVSPQTSDVISEAEIYIAYGRFPQAITFLQNAMEAEPNRADIQLKLLEVYVQTEDATAFNLQLERLKGLGDDDAVQQALELQQQIPGAAEQGAAAMDATVVSNEPVAPVADTGDDDDDLSFDLDDLDAETEDDSFDLSDDGDLDDDAEDLDIDLELGDDDADDDLDLDLEADSTDDDVSTNDDDSIELDLGDDDLEIDLEDSTESASGDDDAEFSLDLDDDDDDDGAIELNLDDDDDDDGAIELNLDDDDDDLDLTSALEEASGSDSDEIELDLGDDDDEITLDLGDDDDEFSLDLGDDDDDDDGIELNLDDDDGDLDLDLGDDDDDGLDLDLDGDDELNLDEDASTKLDLARAYIDMGDTDGARNVLQEVVKDGDESEKAEANELLEKI